MNPDLWSVLPRDLVQLVFVHLPIKKILGLQLFSKFWKETTSTTSASMFLRACDEAHPKMLALISKVHYRPAAMSFFRVRYFDTRSNTWNARTFLTQALEADATAEHLVPVWTEICGEDGGLVLMCMEARNPQSIESLCSFFYVVMNPLTGCERVLPALLDVCNVRFESFLVDRRTHYYKVLVVVVKGKRDNKLVFHSELNQWLSSTEATDAMFGIQSKYDVAREQLSRTSLEEVLQSFAFLKNTMFVLYKSTGRATPTYTIREFVVSELQCATSWVEVDVHMCVPVEHTVKTSAKKLFSSKRWLLVVSTIFVRGTSSYSDEGQIYDLSTRTWWDLPNMPGNEHLWMSGDTFCEIRWNAHP